MSCEPASKGATIEQLRGRIFLERKIFAFTLFFAASLILSTASAAANSTTEASPASVTRTNDIRPRASGQGVLPSASVVATQLPQNPPRFVATFATSFVGVDGVYDAAGNSHTLTSMLTRPMSWGAIAAMSAKPGSASSISLAEKLASSGVSMNDDVGTLVLDTNFNCRIYTPALVFAATNSLSFSATLPIVQVDGSLNPSWRSSQSTVALRNSMKNDPVAMAAIGANDEVMRDRFVSQMAASGMDVNKGIHQTKISSVVLGSRMLLQRNRGGNIAAFAAVSVPLNHGSDASSVAGLSNQYWNSTLGVAFDQSIASKVSIAMNGNYRLNLPYRGSRKISNGSFDVLSHDVDPNVYTDPGDAFSLSLSPQIQPWQFLGASTGLTAVYRHADRIEGGLYAPSRYQGMESRSRQASLLGTVGLNFSPAALLPSKAGIPPMSLGVAYATSLAGFNGPKVSSWTLVLSAVFM